MFLIFIMLNNKIVKKALTNISNFCIINYEIGRSRNVALSSLYTEDKEVMLMIEETMLHIIILLLTAWIITTIIAVALIIALSIVISK